MKTERQILIKKDREKETDSKWKTFIYREIERIRDKCKALRPYNLHLITSLGACIIKLITAVIYGFRKKLESLSMASLSSLV